MSKKQKQPYIPFYVGDYLTDTRILPLNVRGAWVDLILYMWNSEPKGEISGTIDDFARLIGCSAEEIKFCIDLLNERKVCDCEFLEGNRMKLSSRKIKSIVKTAESRKNSGKKGGNPNLVSNKSLFDSDDLVNQEVKLNPEYEYEYKDKGNNTSNTTISTNVVLGEKNENLEEVRNTFQKFWITYDKQIRQLNCEKLWIDLTSEERHQILDYVPKYVLSTPEKQYRLNPDKFLEDKAWYNEIITQNLNGRKNGNSKKPTPAELTAAAKKPWK